METPIAALCDTPSILYMKTPSPRPAEDCVLGKFGSFDSHDFFPYGTQASTTKRIVRTCKNCSFAFRNENCSETEFCCKDCATCFTLNELAGLVVPSPARCAPTAQHYHQPQQQYHQTQLRQKALCPEEVKKSIYRFQKELDMEFSATTTTTTTAIFSYTNANPRADPNNNNGEQEKLQAEAEEKEQEKIRKLFGPKVKKDKNSNRTATQSTRTTAGAPQTPLTATKEAGAAEGRGIFGWEYPFNLNLNLNLNFVGTDRTKSSKRGAALQFYL